MIVKIHESDSSGDSHYEPIEPCQQLKVIVDLTSEPPVRGFAFVSNENKLVVRVINPLDLVTTRKDASVRSLSCEEIDAAGLHTLVPSKDMRSGKVVPIGWVRA